MKKKIAFIDLFIDEWHANNYPKWFRSVAHSEDFELAYAWEEYTQEGARPLQQWCQDFGMIPAESIREAVDKSDCICVLAPSNPEVHQRLADYALQSGKPLFIDKPFAPSRKAAEDIFEKAEKFGTPLMSSSALRFCDELLKSDIRAAEPRIFTTTGGGSSYHEYAIHQLEMIVSVMGTEVGNIIAAGDRDKASVILEYSDGRLASLAYAPRYPFTVTAASGENSFVFQQLQHSFDNMTEAILEFFNTGKPCIPREETIAIAGILEKTIALIEK